MGSMLVQASVVTELSLVSVLVWALFLLCSDCQASANCCGSEASKHDRVETEHNLETIWGQLVNGGVQ